jgi:hypothetical protein
MANSPIQRTLLVVSTSLLVLMMLGRAEAGRQTEPQRRWVIGKRGYIGTKLACGRGVFGRISFERVADENRESHRRLCVEVGVIRAGSSRTESGGKLSLLPLIIGPFHVAIENVARASAESLDMINLPYDSDRGDRRRAFPIIEIGPSVEERVTWRMVLWHSATRHPVAAN